MSNGALVYMTPLGVCVDITGCLCTLSILYVYTEESQTRSDSEGDSRSSQKPTKVNTVV